MLHWISQIKQMVWSQMGGQGLSLHKALIFFFILEPALEKEILEANDINFQTLCMMQHSWIAIKPSGNKGEIFQTLIGIHW
jgi:hypothetical protein